MSAHQEFLGEEQEEARVLALRRIRREWEWGATRIVYKAGDTFECIVVVKRGRYYDCHRYCHLSGNWAISVDRKGASADQAFAWLMNPSANEG